jgi:Domain of Unknown Function (DUF1080)
MIKQASDAGSAFAPWRLCVRYSLAIAIGVTIFLVSANGRAADNQLTEEEKADGWQLLFNGRDLKGWKNNDDKPVKAKVENGTVNPYGSGGYLLVYEKPYGDFAFKCDVKMSQPDCNSGIFVRTGDLSDPVYSGIEAQISSDTKPGRNGFASIYDLVAPSKDATNGPGKWDTVEVRCEGPMITVTVNGEKVTEINCDEWDQPARRPDGSEHKFDKAIKDFPREGYIGLQDHGHDVWYKNIKLKEL